MADSPAIRIMIKLDTSYSLDLYFNHTDETLLLTDCESSEYLRTLRDSLGEQLDYVKNATKGQLDLRQKPDLMNAVMRRLHKTGRVVLTELLGYQRHQLAKLHRLCNAAAAAWRDPHLPPIIEVHGDVNALVPIECLALFGNPAYVPITDDKTLEHAASPYAGFRAIIHRQIRNSDTSQRPLRLHGTQLPVKLFYHARLPGAQNEAAFFQRYVEAGRVELEGPWPTDSDGLADAVRILDDHLNDPGASFAPGRRRAVPDQVQHFACHCDTYPRPDDERWDVPNIRLGTAEHEKRIRQRDLALDWSERYSDSEERALPLIFMNACDTSRINPATASSFAKYFLHGKHHGFIGTETAIPDKIASEVSASFYRRLLAGDPLGLALWRARRLLMYRYGNPLGLFYTMYADPGVGLE